MKLSLVIPVLNHKDITQSCIESFCSTADKWRGIDCLVIDNGSQIPATEWNLGCRIIRNEHNIGVLPALQQGYENTVGQFIFYTHNDVIMYERDWDRKILRLLTQLPNVGVAGFFGAKGI